MRESTLNGYLKIKGLTSEFPELTVIIVQLNGYNKITYIFLDFLWSRSNGTKIFFSYTQMASGSKKWSIALGMHINCVL